MAVNEGVLDDVPLDRVTQAETKLRQTVTKELSEVCDRISAGKSLSDEDKEAILNKSQTACKSFKPEPQEAEAEKQKNSETEPSDETEQEQEKNNSE